jgi:Sulfotransferase family
MRQWLPALRDLLRRARDGRAAAPVFIVGEARSGTSIVYRSLLAHPSFAVRDLNLAESFAVQRLLEHPTLEPGTAPELESYMFEDETRFAEFTTALRTVRWWRAMILPLTRRRPVVPLFRVSLTGIALRAYVDVATEARGCRRLVEKTPHNVAYADQLLATFPLAKLLYVIRHPVDTLSSYRRRQCAEPGASWTGVSVHDFCQRWESSVLLAVRHARRHPRLFLIVRYEAFTGAPETSFAGICAFVHEPFVAGALAEVPGGYGAWKIDPHLFGPIVGNTKTWEEHLSVAEASAVEDRLAEPMAVFGYDRYT